MLTLGFAGLPSAGKSTMINSLAGKRVLESGIRRTTTEVCLIGAVNTVGAQKWVRARLESDDGVEFCALDLPGICDAEDVTGSFNKVTREWASKCDVVVWVTDARSAFLTSREASEYAALRASIQEKADEDGTLYQFCVVLAKYEPRGTFVRAPEYLDDEIRTPREESTVEWNLERVARIFSADARVVPFSAFKRVATCGSGALRSLFPVLSAHPSDSSDANGRFDLKWATEGLVEKRLALVTRVLRDLRRRVAPAARYERSAEFVFNVWTTNAQGQYTTPVTVFSLPVALDGAAVDESFVKTHGRGYPRVASGIMSFGHVATSGLTNMRQIVAPLVRPVYGDVLVVPACISSFVCSGGAAGYNSCFAVCTSAETTRYALKVGEAARDRLDALLALDIPDACFVRCVLE